MTSRPPMAIENLSVSYGDTEVLKSITLTVVPGQIHAIVGLNGAGKTTLMRAALGMLSPTVGTASLFGHASLKTPRDSLRRIGYVIDTAFAYPELTGWENVYASARLHLLSRQEANRATTEAIDRFALHREAGKRAATLSMGNRQRVALAAAFAHRPELVVLDEPTNGLDPSGVVALRGHLRQIADQDQTGILVSSHHLDEMARVADIVTVIHRGEVISKLDPSGVDLEKKFFDLVYEAETREQA